jgi:hypothetical protein
MPGTAGTALRDEPAGECGGDSKATDDLEGRPCREPRVERPREGTLVGSDTDEDHDEKVE